MNDLISMLISFLFYILTGIALYITAYSSNENRWTYKLVLLCTAGIVLWDLYLYEYGYTIQMAPLYVDSILSGTGIFFGSLAIGWYAYIRKYKTYSVDFYANYSAAVTYIAVKTIAEIGGLLIWSWVIAGSDLFHISLPVSALVFSILFGQTVPTFLEEDEDDD